MIPAAAVPVAVSALSAPDGYLFAARRVIYSLVAFSGRPGYAYPTLREELLLRFYYWFLWLTVALTSACSFVYCLINHFAKTRAIIISSWGRAKHEPKLLIR